MASIISALKLQSFLSIEVFAFELFWFVAAILKKAAFVKMAPSFFNLFCKFCRTPVVGPSVLLLLDSGNFDDLLLLF